MIYRYKAYKADKQLIKGTIESTSIQLAEENLYAAGFQRIMELHPTRPAFNLKKINIGSVKISKEALMDFTNELAILTESGLTLLIALRQLEKQSNSGTLKQVISKLANDLQGGVTFHQALRMHPNIFSESYCSVIEANEKAGTLDSGMKQITKELKADIATRSQIQRATTQPMIIIGLAIAVLILLIIVVLPPLADIFRQFGANLPITTKILIGFSDFVSSNLIAIAFVLILLIVILVVIIKSPTAKPYLDKYILRMPAIGQIVNWNNTARFSRSLCNLLGAGILLPDGINIMLKGIGNSYYRNALSDVRKRLVQGQSLSDAIRNNKLFPPLLVEMIGVGESSGNLDFALGMVADYFEAKVDKRITRLTALIEPALIICVGLIVGFIAITMISTIYGLVGSFSA